MFVIAIAAAGGLGLVRFSFSTSFIKARRACAFSRRQPRFNLFRLEFHVPFKTSGQFLLILNSCLCLPRRLLAGIRRVNRSTFSSNKLLRTAFSISAIFSLKGCDFFVDLLIPQFNGSLFVLCSEESFRLIAGEENGLEPVIVFLGKRVVFVVMATGTADRQAHKDRTRGRDNVVQLIHSCLFVVCIIDGRAISAEPGGYQSFRVAWLQFVTRQLFLDEAVIRLVIIEGADDIIPVAPGVRTIHVKLEAAAVGVACQVQPMPSPSFSVVR